MAKYVVDSADLVTVADAIRTKGETSGQLVFPAQFVAAIEAIKGSGASPQIIVTAPEGSTITATNGEKTVTGVIGTGGTLTLNLPDFGTWTVTASLNGQTATASVTIDPPEVEQVTLEYYATPDYFNLSAYGTKGTDYEVYTDSGAVIPASDYGKHENWKIKLFTGGTLKATKALAIDVFCVGGGGGGGACNSGGGGGGYTNTMRGVQVTAGSSNTITIGGGGTAFLGSTVPDNSIGNGGNGGQTKAFGCTAGGGYGGKYAQDISGAGGNGGSGGGSKGNGGSDGANGSGDSPGKGQKTTKGPNGETGSTREFGETTGTLYAGGGGGVHVTEGTGGAGGGGRGGWLRNAEAGSANTGGGGGGAGWGSDGGKGGSGIVVIRNAR